jgi:excisionase family DNA binding protein
MTANPSPSPAPSIPILAMRPREAAAALSVSERTLWAWTAAGEVPHIKRGKTVLYSVPALTAWLAEQSTGGNGEARR